MTTSKNHRTLDKTLPCTSCAFRSCMSTGYDPSTAATSEQDDDQRDDG